MTQSKDFAWAIAFAWWPIFKMASFLEYFVFFGAVFCTEQLEIIFRKDFDMVSLNFNFLTQSEDFASAIAFAWWPIFKMVSFLEYFVFFGAGFCTEQLQIICRKDFDMFFWILIFDPKQGFCMGYSLCMMADFQNGLISRIFRVFWSGFLHRTSRNHL